KQKDPELKLAAERYLESEDSVEAQSIRRKYHAGEILILGARGDFYPTSQEDECSEWEKGLLDELKKKDGPDEIYGEFSPLVTSERITSEQIIVRVRNDKAELCKQRDAARVDCRQLSDDELQSLRAIFAPDSFDKLPPLILPSEGEGIDEYEFLRLNKSGGRRAYAVNLYQSENFLPYAPLHAKLHSFFDRLSATGEFEVRYALKGKIGSVEVLAADDKHPIKHVCMQGSEVRALVKDEDWESEKTETREKWIDEIWNWHALSDGKLGKVTEEPDACRI